MMQNNNNNGNCALFARGFAALGAMLAIGLGLMGSPVAAAPFAYVANRGANTVSVIDTATNPPTVVGNPIPVAGGAAGIAVTPDAKHAYVLGGGVSVIDTASNIVGPTVPVSGFSIAISQDGKLAYVADGALNVIDTATNMVIKTLPTALIDGGIAITPNGKYAYGTHNFDPTKGYVSVIDTAKNKVVATIVTGFTAGGIAVTPDGNHVYVLNNFLRWGGAVQVIATATNTGVSTVPVPRGTYVYAIAITPNGKRAYVTGKDTHTGNVVLVIDTASNTVVGPPIPVPVGAGIAIAITPDGKHAYVANINANNVTVIDTASNTVVGPPIPVGSGPVAVGIVPPPPGIPFLAFSAKLRIRFGGAPNQDSFALQSSFALSSTAPAIHPLAEAVTLQAGTFTVTILPGSFKRNSQGSFTFTGVIDGVRLKALITPTGTLRYALQASATGASLTGTNNPVQVSLIIGGNSGTTSVNATNLGGLGVALQ